METTPTKTKTHNDIGKLQNGPENQTKYGSEQMAQSEIPPNHPKIQTKLDYIYFRHKGTLDERGQKKRHPNNGIFI